VGWAVVPESLIPRLSIAKHASDMDVCSFTQRSVSALLDRGIMVDHLARLRHAYRERRDLMLSAMHRHFPEEVAWTEPQSGLFIWVELPHSVDAVELLKIAIESERVAFIPGQAFSQGGRLRANNCLRLNFSNCPITQIEEGIAGLGRVINTMLNESCSWACLSGSLRE
jgi:DNA-binding transcriptional MocR family regulator